MGTEYYRELNAALTDEDAVGTFRTFLELRDVSHFNPDAPPPITEAKREAQRATRTPLAQVLGELVEEATGVFKSDLVTREHVERGIAAHGSVYDVGPMLPARIADALRAIGAIRLDTRPRLGPDKRRPRLWALRDGARYRAMDATELASAYLRQEQSGFVGGSALARHTAQVIQLEGGG